MVAEIGLLSLYKTLLKDWCRLMLADVELIINSSCTRRFNVSISRLQFSLRPYFSWEKNENSSARQKLFFHYKLISEHMLIYIQLYIRLKAQWNDLFGVFFSFEVKKIFRLQIALNSRYAKECNQKPWLRSDISLSRS